MSEIQLYLLEPEKNTAESQAIAAQTATKLEHKQLKLIDFVTSLEEHINHKDDGAVRAKSVRFLADVLEKVPPKVLSGQERRLLNDFILGRIEGDVEGIGASSRALMALERLGKWDSETAQKVIHTYLANTHPLRQFKLQTERFSVVQLLDVVIAKYRETMKEVHETDENFMTAFVSYFEGEKDPRNLMIIFSILQVPMTEWNIQRNAQELFEAVFNYFPITFKPPPDDPYGITAQDLKERLRACISASAEFAPHSIPALLDKLDSISSNTKTDVLQTLQACILNYGPSTTSVYSITLWDALKFEILNVQEEVLAEDSLKTLAAIAAILASQDAPLSAYLRPIIKECNEHLEDAPTTKSSAAGRILHAIAASAPSVADKVIRGVAPNLFALYTASDSITKRRGLLEVFNELTRAYYQLDNAPTHALDITVLQTIVPEALEAMLLALLNAPKSEVSFRLTALQGLTKLVSISKLLSEKESLRVVNAVAEIILHEHVEGHGDIRADSITALIEMSKHAPTVVRDNAIPAFMVELPDVPSQDSAWEPVLEAFAQLSTEQQIFDTVVLRLKGKLSAARFQNAPSTYQDALLLAILYTFTRGSPAQEDGIIRTSYFTEFVAPLVATIRDNTSGSFHGLSLEILGRLCNVVLRSQSLHFQASVYNENLQWLSPAENPNLTDTQLSSLSPFLLYYYAAIKPEVVDAADIAALLRLQARHALGNPEATRNDDVVLQVLSLLINKFIKPSAMQPTLESAGMEVKALLHHRTDVQAISISFAVVKALLIQGKCSKITSEYLDLLCSLLSQSSGRYVARQFSGLLAPDGILTKENHCLVSGLYKQRIFSSTVPKLFEAIRTANDTTIKSNHLVALSGILRWIPYSILETSLTSLLPPLLQTLDLLDTDAQTVKASSLTIFEATLMHNPDVVAEHAGSLISRLLNCTTTRIAGGHAPDTTASAASNSASVRAKALLCLTLVPQRLRRETVLPFRRRVVQRLLACLDDAKRNVRSEAVKCRKAWLGLEEDEE